MSPLMPLLVLVLMLTGAGAGRSEFVLDVRPADVPPVPPRPFIAAVVETVWAAGHPEVDLLTDTPWRRNMEIVRQRTEAAAEQGADLLVLAEYGILSVLPRETLARFAAEMPSADDLAVPCDDPSQHEVTANLSCLARTHRLYIVANYIEKEQCSVSSDPSSQCPEDGFSLFNTNMVFDRDGRLIQKYRKYNLFGEELDCLQTPAPHTAAFRTDFGAVIGLMTCFDILFEVPAVQLTRLGVTHFAFPTLWGDELPSLTALQMHSAWARSLDVTVLSSNLHRLSTGSIGSGIFTGQGALNYTYDYTSSGSQGALLTATIPLSDDACNEVDGACATDLGPKPAAGGAGKAGRKAGFGDDDTDAYYPILNYNMSEFVSVELTGQSQELCDGDFCCQLTVSDQGRHGETKKDVETGDSPATYRLLVLNGRRNFAPHWSTQICAVVLCADATQASCSTFPSGVAPAIRPFSLSASYGADWVVFPSVIRTHMELAADWRYDRSTRHLSVADTNSMFVAQLYGRNYALDNCVSGVNASAA